MQMMKYGLSISLFCLVFFFSGFSCNKEDRELPEPLRNKIEDYYKNDSWQQNCSSCPSIIDQYRWKNDIVYIYTCNGPACLCAALFYDADGRNFEPGTETRQTFFQEAVFVRNVWKCSDK